MSEQKISIQTRKKILDELLVFDFKIFGKFEQDDLFIEFLNRIWNLNNMVSEDPRFKNAYDDIWQHTINNKDWNLEYLLVERLKVLENENTFISFIEYLINPETRNSIDEIDRYIGTINSFLEHEPAYFVIVDYFNSTPVYRLELKTSLIEEKPSTLQLNDIEIHVIEKQRPDKRNILVLKPSYWDDYGSKTLFEVYYIDKGGSGTSIGAIKIMKQGVSTTSEVIPSIFTQLEESYCSLGTDEKFYLNLKKIFPENFKSILYGLRDAAFFPKILEKFKDDVTFTSSLTRDDDAKRIIKRIRVSLSNISEWEYFSFKYNFKPPFSDEQVQIDFGFKTLYDNNYTERIYALIGENGTGKTQLLSSLANELSKNRQNVFFPRKPLFDKIMTVSYSYFDRFEIPKPNAEFNYAYCGLRDIEGKMMTHEEMLTRFNISKELIIRSGKMKIWYDVLKILLGSEFVDSIMSLDHHQYKGEFHQSEFLIRQKSLSSGHSILLFILTELVKNITHNSIIFYDEPETHLHPNIITDLMRIIIQLVDEYDSFCIIATHSPVIIRELYARNVYVIKRDEDSFSIDNINIETFGETVTKITEEVFQNQTIKKNYNDVIERYIQAGQSYNQIMSSIMSSEIPISLQTRLLIKSLLQNEKS